MPNFLVRICASFFFVGFMPLAPGSMATILGVLLSIIFFNNLIVYAGVFALVTAIGYAVAGKMEKLAGKKDPSCVVIDEVAGTMIAFFMLPMTPAVIMTGYFLFRAFDMFKIYPANKLEDLGGAQGIMADDLVAGLYTNIVMQVALKLTGLV